MLHKGTAVNVAGSNEDRDAVLARVSNGEFYDSGVGCQGIRAPELDQRRDATSPLRHFHYEIVFVAYGVGLAVPLVKLGKNEICHLDISLVYITTSATMVKTDDEFLP